MPRTTRPPVFLLTGTPGTGKTTWAKALGKSLKLKVIAEKAFVKKHRLGTWDPTQKEWEVDLAKYARALKQEMRSATRPLLLEGHLLCEIRLPVNGVIVLTCSPTELERRLRARQGYSEVKVQDNVFCEEQEYCLSRVKTNYPRVPRLVVATHKPKKGVRSRLVDWVSKQIQS